MYLNWEKTKKKKLFWLFYMVSWCIEAIHSIQEKKMLKNVHFQWQHMFAHVFLEDYGSKSRKWGKPSLICDSSYASTCQIIYIQKNN